MNISVQKWKPLPGALPDSPRPDTVYVIPTRVDSEEGQAPLYDDWVRPLPKQARSQGVPVEFSIPTANRRYLQEYGIDQDTWSVAFACLEIVNEWLVLAVGVFLEHRARRHGWSSEKVKELPLKVAVAETSSGRNYLVEGRGSDVVEALKVLGNGNQSEAEDSSD